MSGEAIRGELGGRSGVGAAEDVRSAAAALGGILGDRRPRVAITVGSGLGALGTRIEDPVEIPYRDLPGWPLPTVEGHEGRAIAGSLGGVPVLGLSGRVHAYEGAESARTVFYVRVLGELEVPILFLSNAAGAIHPTFTPGELMLISDHINMMFRSPLSGPVLDGEDRFPDLCDLYDPQLRTVVRETALGLGVRLQEGVYAAMHGPSYETPAEIRMLERLGAHAVGMSTVPEVIAARARGIRCVAVSCLTNYAAGVTSEPLDHGGVLEVTVQVQDDFERLLAGSIPRFE